MILVRNETIAAQPHLNPDRLSIEELKNIRKLNYNEEEETAGILNQILPQKPSLGGAQRNDDKIIGMLMINQDASEEPSKILSKWSSLTGANSGGD